MHRPGKPSIMTQKDTLMPNVLQNCTNLEEMMAVKGGPLNLLRSSNYGSHVFPGIPPEFTNWRDEQRAWQSSCALLESSYHMTNLYFHGPDAKALLTRIGVNKIGDFPTGRGKQLIAASPDGYLIADGICFHTSDDIYRVSAGPTISDWVQFNIETGGYDVEFSRDETTGLRGGKPLQYVYQIQGPHALALMNEVTDGTLPKVSFFGIGEFQIRGRPVRALRHGMAGAPGFEIFGPWADQPAVMEALMEVGEKYGLRKVGALAFPTTSIESGWMATTLPAVYHSEEMKPFREWLKPNSRPALASLGGSLESDDIRDYYMDPVEVGYGPFINFDEDFIGRDALAEKLKNPKRKKVTLVWNDDDVMEAMRNSLFTSDQPSRFIKLPLAIYSTYQCDEVVKNGQRVGVSQYAGVSANAGKMLSLSLVDIEHSEPGTEVTLRWGEPNSRRQTVERNMAFEIRATVAPSPYFQKKIKSANHGSS
jgi:vanillate/3-O-methylgallate O-demethylase